MKIKSTHLQNFMAFKNFKASWSPEINIISGENGRGKTALIKIMYALAKAWLNSGTKNKANKIFTEKIANTFKPENGNIGRIVQRKQNPEECVCEISIEEHGTPIKTAFGPKAKSHIETLTYPSVNEPEASVVYIPPSEIISAVENFRFLYEDMHIAFDETYYDLVKALDRPLTKQQKTLEQKQILSAVNEIINGSVTQNGNRFYIRTKTDKNVEMALVPESHRKLATIAQLILNGSLHEKTILFWDEPETNMDHEMTRLTADIAMLLAKTGTQIFITTHDYFLQQYFNTTAGFYGMNPDDINIKLISI